MWRICDRAIARSPIWYSQFLPPGVSPHVGIEKTPLEPDPAQTGGGSAAMSDFSTAFPNSTKVFVDGPQAVRVPMREIGLDKGASAIRVYDTSGPQGHDPTAGLPRLREPWVTARLERDPLERGPSTSSGSSRALSRDAEHPPLLEREALAERRPRCVTQLHYARKGEITPEMEFIAIREGLPAEFVRDEVARGRAIIPANIRHLELEPMIIGRNFLVKINANIGNSAVSSSIEDEVEKLQWATLWGADTVMDLSTGKNI